MRAREEREGGTILILRPTEDYKVDKIFQISGVLVPELRNMNTVGQDIFTDMIFSRISRKYHVRDQDLNDLITKKLY